MANVVKYNVRVIMKHGTSSEWAAATGFTPLLGEIIVYTDLNKIKVGDGETNVDALDFLDEFGPVRYDVVQSLSDAQKQQARENIGLFAGEDSIADIKVQDAVNAEMATNATNDASGHPIEETYATKAELTTHADSAANTYATQKSVEDLELDLETHKTTEASSNGLGHIKIGYTENGKNYPVELNTQNQAFVNVPWTDTNTKVTSVDNHYTPTENSSVALSADASSTTAATWGTTALVTGVNLQRDAKGHVTGVTVDSIKMPSNPDTDTGATSVEVTGSGNAVTGASYNSSSRKIILNKGVNFELAGAAATAEQNANTYTDNKIALVMNNSSTAVDSVMELATAMSTNKDAIDALEEIAANKVSSIKLGTISYNPASGVVSLPAYPTTLPASDVYSWAKAATKPSYTKSEIGLGEVANERQYSANNPPPYPVTSVNGKTGAVTISESDVTSALGHTPLTREEIVSLIQEAIAPYAILYAGTSNPASSTGVDGDVYIQY